MTRKHTAGKIALILLLLAAALAFLYPFFLILLNSLKTNQEINRSVLTMPTELRFDNYTGAWQKMNYPRVLCNSLVITVSGVLGIVFLSSMCAYQLARKTILAGKIILSVFLGAMVVPFQVLIVPIMIVSNNLHLANTLHGLILMYLGLMLPMAVFLYHGFIKSVPRELEEAAQVDGCGEFKAFFLVVFPLLKPITSAVMLFNFLGIFNDFMLPLLMISEKQQQTIPLAISTFFMAFSNQWNLVMAGFVLSVVPIIAFFLALQRNFISGLTAGAVKG